ncbi:MAG: hypothetical protein LUG52_02155 [Clostridia bacterium]|nr:hypothetical protein [Clostridia bacterium]
MHGKKFCALFLAWTLIFAAMPCGAASYCYLDISEITSGGVCQIEAGNMSENDIDSTIYLAVSDDEGIVKGVVSENLSIAADDRACAEINLPKGTENGDIVTAFLWRETEPLADVLSQKITSLTDAEATRSDAEASVMVVTRNAMTLADGKDSYKITGMINGASTSIIVNPDSAEDMALSETIAAGNVIVYEENGNYAENIAVLFNATKTSLGEVSGDGGSISDTPSDKCVNVAGGWVAAKTSSYFCICETLDELESGEFEAEILYAPTSYCSYTLVTKTSSGITVEKGSFEDIIYSASNPRYVFVKTTADSASKVTDVVIYAGYAK